MAAGDYPAGPPPKEAVDYLRHKGVRAGYDYREIWREEHAIAFTVANMMKLDMLEDVQASITKAQEEGWPAERWKKEMAEEMAKRGWWGRRGPPDPNDPKDAADAKRYMSRRLDIIWRVNTRQAAQAGVWERGQRSKSHPYVLYRVGPSKKHRDQHLAWDGVLLSKDDPFWAVANPMNGWGCKCYTRFVSRAQYERYLRDKIPDPPQGDATPKGRKKVTTDSPNLKVRRYKNDETGTMHTGFEGIDDGFERNPGVGRMEQLGEQFRRADRRMALAWDVHPGEPSTKRPNIKPVADGLDVKLTDPATKRKAEATIDAIDTFHRAAGLPRIPVIDREPNESHLGGFTTRWDDGSKRYVADHIELAATETELSAAHEIGHFLDFAGLQPDGSYNSEASAIEDGLRLLLEEIKETNAWKGLIARRDDAKNIAATTKGALLKELYQGLQEDYEYLLQPSELFARAYAQYVAWRSGNATMLAQIDDILAREDPKEKLEHWPYADFLPLIHRFDNLFETHGWLSRTKL